MCIKNGLIGTEVFVSLSGVALSLTLKVLVEIRRRS